MLDTTSTTPPADAALLVVGAVTGLRDHLRWFDERPLFGRRVVVTRSQEQARELVERLENAGAQAILAPTFRLTPPGGSRSDRSRRGVGRRLSVGRLRVGERRHAVSGGARARAARPARARRRIDLRGRPVHGGSADRERHQAGCRGRRVRRGTDRRCHRSRGSGRQTAGCSSSGPITCATSSARISTRRGAVVTDLVAYRTAAASPDSPAAQELYRLLLEGKIDAVTFTSPTAVARFASLIGEEQAADLLNTTVVATIGPVTAAAATELGIKDPLIADTYTVDGLGARR